MAIPNIEQLIEIMNVCVTLRDSEKINLFWRKKLTKNPVLAEQILEATFGNPL